MADFSPPGFKMCYIVFKLWFVRYYKVWPLFFYNKPVKKKKLVSFLKSQVNLGYVGGRVESEADCDNGQEATAGPRLSYYYCITTITTI